MKHAYSTIELKSVNDERRILAGLASTPMPDRVGDIVEPKGAVFTLPIPFLWQHDSKQPIGHVTRASVTDKGIQVEVQLARIDEPGRLKDRLDEAWQSIKAGLVRGMSIGFAPSESAEIKGTFGLRYLKWAWLELSAVTIPANADASIQTIKSLDQHALRAATGASQGPVVLVPHPGVSGSKAAAFARGAVSLIPRNPK